MDLCFIVIQNEYNFSDAEAEDYNGQIKHALINKAVSI